MRLRLWNDRKETGGCSGIYGLGLRTLKGKLGWRIPAVIPISLLGMGLSSLPRFSCFFELGGAP